ncbi:hypothetical protein TSOC_014199, partial [Tetrabaena socialis]
MTRDVVLAAADAADPETGSPVQQLRRQRLTTPASGQHASPPTATPEAAAGRERRITLRSTGRAPLPALAAAARRPGRPVRVEHRATSSASWGSRRSRSSTLTASKGCAPRMKKEAASSYL